MKFPGKVLRQGLAGSMLVAGVSMAADTAPRVPAYGSVMQGNQAVDYTVSDYLMRPHLIGDDLQFLSGHGGTGFADAIFSFRGAGMNWVGGVTTGAAPDASEFRLGIGIGNTFGAGILYELNKAETDDGTTVTKTTAAGDSYGVFGSFNLGFINLFGELSRVTTPAANTETETGGTATVDQKNVATNIMVGAAKETEGEGSHALAAILSISLGSTEDNIANTDASTTSVGLLINHGVPVKYSDEFAVFAGGGLSFLYGSGEAGTTETSSMAIILAPNMEFQRTLGKGFETFLGVSANIFQWGSTSTDVATVTTDASTIHTIPLGVGSGDLGVGLRWAYENFALEGQVSKGLILNGPDFIGGGAGTGLFGSVGLAVGF